MRLGHSCFGDHFILSCGYIGIMRHHWVIETHIKAVLGYWVYSLSLLQMGGQILILISA
jgi:hypothetical protein